MAVAEALGLGGRAGLLLAATSGACRVYKPGDVRRGPPS